MICHMCGSTSEALIMLIAVIENGFKVIGSKGSQSWILNKYTDTTFALIIIPSMKLSFHVEHSITHPPAVTVPGRGSPVVPRPH